MTSLGASNPIELHTNSSSSNDSTSTPLSLDRSELSFESCKSKHPPPEPPPTVARLNGSDSSNASSSSSSLAPSSTGSSFSKKGMSLVLAELLSMKKRAKKADKKHLRALEQLQHQQIQAEAHLEEQLELQRVKLLNEMMVIANSNNSNNNNNNNNNSNNNSSNNYLLLKNEPAHHHHHIHQQLTPNSSSSNSSDLTPEEAFTQANTHWRQISEKLTEFRSNNYKSNLFHVRRIFHENKLFLNPLKTLCPHIQSLICMFLTNSSKRIHGKKNRTKIGVIGYSSNTLKELSEDEAIVLGRAFRKFLLRNKEPSTAVDAWRLDNPMLQPLFDNFPPFQPIMASIAKTLLVTSNMGLVRRVILGAGLSICDMITDVMVISSYYEAGDTEAANTLLTMILFNLFVQLVITLCQNHQKSKIALLRECLIAISCMKPAVDAYRVATGYENEQNSMNPLVEMALGKGGELAFESIPGVRDFAKREKLQFATNSPFPPPPPPPLQDHFYKFTHTLTAPRNQHSTSSPS